MHEACLGVLRKILFLVLVSLRHGILSLRGLPRVVFHLTISIAGQMVMEQFDCQKEFRPNGNNELRIAEETSVCIPKIDE